MHRVDISKRALKQLDAAARWWEEHRDKAPEAFDEDMTAAFEDLAETPLIGNPVHSRRPGLRRLLIPRIRYYVYYRVESATVRIKAIWHASRRPPRL